MMNYIDPTTWLPAGIGELYCNNNLRLTGSVRINPLNPAQIDTLNIAMICSPYDGGNAAIANIPDGTYNLADVGSTLWIDIPRTGTVTSTPDPYVNGVQPRPRKNYVQIAYRSLTGVVMFGGFLIQTPRFQVLGALLPASYFTVGSVPNADFPTLWAALASPLIVSGSHIVVVSDQAIAVDQIISNSNVRIEFLLGVKITCSLPLTSVLTFTGNGIITQNFNLALSHGTLTTATNALVFASNYGFHQNLLLSNNGAGTVTNGISLNAGAQANSIQGTITKSAGVMTNYLVNNSGTFSNNYQVSYLP